MCLPWKHIQTHFLELFVAHVTFFCGSALGVRSIPDEAIGTRLVVLALVHFLLSARDQSGRSRGRCIVLLFWVSGSRNAPADRLNRVVSAMDW